MASNAPIRKSRLGKNKKKAWKAIDITEVEDVLEDERMQERTGGLVADKTDEQLFMVDKVKPTEEINEQVDQKKKRKREPKKLKCHANLELDPKIKPIFVSHDVKKVTLEVERLAKKIKSGKVTVTEKLAQRQRHRRNVERHQARLANRKLPVADFDLWGEEEKHEEEDPHYREVTKKRRVNVPKHYNQKTSELPSVQIPHPGASYNPSYEDHQDLLAQANDIELKQARKERKLYNSLEAKFRSVTAKELEENLQAEMTSGLNEKEEEVAHEFTAEELEDISVAPPVRREDKKTRSQRNKEKQKQKQEKAKRKEKVLKTRENEIFRLKTIQTEIKSREKDLAKRKEERMERQKKQGVNTRKLGKMKYEEPEVEVKLSDELVGSLRLLKPEGHLLADRFKSLQKRNVIEPRLEAKKWRKYKPKTFLKKGQRPEET